MPVTGALFGDVFHIFRHYHTRIREIDAGPRDIACVNNDAESMSKTGGGVLPGQANASARSRT